ncbi:MAG: tRNA (adenosine(37)-N6)-threonylcarbamoyltransferase complex dimerization subunit type 1 TsaB [Pseudomonadota bacterium]|uniref:tRNA threonylcarbamoyladenosine biosynthesis protein TsaB n=1 Tax=Alteromonas alba TaxID=2079529 RepID=A0A2S9V7R8_9ALTE|nr:tRNA (adenosine(37)-N6)-threonylcarbamoyltransferase complex dimerization subunit type 1 TsaB [Alteromonas alba]MAJ70624.1 tRNA (adenosine(37)-N6)-threonylcarbamoyltransferase complex dimerization subunit type 1 TsaB [Alteromonadaceae bacterium]MCP4864696.1 tRNA (adenosine(37)-N6)-threonylcarbamoyltransferase complex dimerization subunit type 1 TsaB [Alteromonas sp.]MDY6929590.1 tRNA (adenosine(37)-N6)-threonylcarbamoyltransferase complex dimerization subunit type 1 TsaB [Pseudomonadota bacte|tara:strand:+ start:8481 stop:9158 length:678 start_codon:yes stop_codon:yes gene_type:complete
MNILTIDTATEACSVALQFNQALFTRYEVCPQQHSQKILPMVDAVMKEAGASLAALDGLGFGRGPGSFTGVRIATGIIQGLALGSQLPVAGVSTLAAMAQQVINSGDVNDVAVAIDARMGEVYFAHYQNQQGIATLVGEEQVTSPEAVAEQLDVSSMAVAGTGWQAYPVLSELLKVQSVNVSYPYARFMLPLTEQTLNAGQGMAVDAITPEYLRNTVTWKKLPGR